MSEQREWFEIDYSKSYTRDNHRGEAVEFDGFLIPAPSDLLSRAEWEASIESCDQCGGPVVAIRGPYPYAPDRMVCPTCLVEQLESLVSDVNLFAESTALNIKEDS